MIGMMHLARRLAAPRAATLAAAALVAGGLAISAGAQTQTPFGGFKHDASQPIQVSSDSLQVRNSDQVAIFEGQVDVIQGAVRMRADRLEVSYRDQNGETASPDQGAINRLRAIGNVLISNGEETAKADEADYDVASGQIVLLGNVVLLQGENIVKGRRLRIDLATGTAKMDSGRVQVSLEPAGAGN